MRCAHIYLMLLSLFCLLNSTSSAETTWNEQLMKQVVFDSLEDISITLLDEEWDCFDFEVYYSDNENHCSVYVSHKDVTTLGFCVLISNDYTLLETDEFKREAALFAEDYNMMKRSLFHKESLIQIIYDKIISNLTSTSIMRLKEMHTLEALGWDQIPWGSLHWDYEFYYTYLTKEEKERFPGGTWSVLISYPYEYSTEEVYQYLSPRYGELIPNQLMELYRTRYITWLDIGIDAITGSIYHVDTTGCFEIEPY